MIEVESGPTIRGWSVARAWFGIATLCAAIQLTVAAVFSWIAIYTEPGHMPAVNVVVGVLAQTTASIIGTLGTLSVWIALRLGASAPVPRERRIAYALAILPLAATAIAIGFTAWFFMR